jgi:hydroxyacylglutathione hydrolase
VPLESQFAIWTAYLVDPSKGEKIIIVCEPGKEKEVIIRLARTGLDCCIGYLEGGFNTWSDAGFSTEASKIIKYENASDFEGQAKDVRVIDVRNPGEWANGVLQNAELYRMFN